MNSLVVMGTVTTHRVPFPEHYAEVMASVGRVPNAEEDTEVWYWETQHTFHDGTNWDTTTCIFMLDQVRSPLTRKPFVEPGGARYVRTYESGWPEWRWLDPAHPRCWTCGRFYPRGRIRSISGPCEGCSDDSGISW